MCLLGSTRYVFRSTLSLNSGELKETCYFSVEHACGSEAGGWVAASVPGAGPPDGTTVRAGVKPQSTRPAEGIQDKVECPLFLSAKTGQPSYKQIGSKATVSINPLTQQIIQVNPTSAKLTNKLSRQ